MPKAKLTDFLVRKTNPPTGRDYLDIPDLVLPGFYLRINRGGTRSFFVVTRVKGTGRQIRKRLGTYPHISLADARESAREIMRLAQGGVAPDALERLDVHREQRERLSTFAGVCEEFLVDYVQAKQLRTAREIERMIRVELIPRWGALPISEIKRVDVKTMLREKARTAPVSAARTLAVAQKIFNWALDEGIIDATPIARLTPPAPPRERDRVLSNDEIKALWGASAKMGYPFGAILRLLFVTGQRRGEVAGMRWSEIDGTFWTIPAERSKSARAHRVALSPLAIRMLETLPRVGECVMSSGRVGDKPVSGFSWAKQLADKLSGVEDWRVHDIRRTVATKMRELGIDRLTVSQVLGHAEGGITRIYDRYSADSEKRHALETWARYLDDLEHGRPANVTPLRGANG
jgi:integrase